MSSPMTEAEFKAREARRGLGMLDSEPLEIAKLLRLVKGITIIRRPFEGDMSGCFMRGATARLIVVNSSRTLGHQNFTIAHEYYHLLFEPDLTGSVCSTEQFGGSKSEATADSFAANLLMPAEALSEAVYRVRGTSRRALAIADLIQFEQLFGVSHKAMLRRLKEQRYLTSRQAEELKDGVTWEARVLGFDVSLYEPTNDLRILSPYPHMAKEALQRGLITEGKYRELLMEGGFFNLLSEENGEEVPKRDEG